MCVLALAHRAHPRWRLVAIANRDEFHGRAAAPLAEWDEVEILAGRDLVGGGTWLGVAPGRFAALTNLRSDVPPDPENLSRGGLVTDLLTAAAPDTIPLDRYNPFSLIAVAGDHPWLLTNRPEPRRERLAPGLHGLTNGPFERPWPKLAGLTRALREWLEVGAGTLEPLFAALRDERVPAGAYDEATALPPFIRNPAYGTRCSTVVAIDADGAGRIVERRFSSDGLDAGETALDFRWPEP
ncbi:MAG TPA: NRDE family protein [Novosphingobium sp.]|nr:NRDE family protein [Novosphingobium sp.]